MAGQTVGLKPSTFVEGGGLVGDIDVTFKDTKFVLWDYNGKMPDANPAVFANLVDENGEVHEQYWSCGQAKDWVPSENGKTLVAVGSNTALNVNSNGGMLITSIVNSGFPEDKISDDIGVFDGLKAHVVRQVVKREGLTKAPRADGRTFEPTVLVVSKIISLPWEGKGGTATTTKAAGKDNGAGSSGGGSLEEKVQGAILDILAAEGKGVPKQQLVTKVYQAFKDSPDRAKIVQMVHKDEFLGNGPWVLNGGVVSLG